MTPQLKHTGKVRARAQNKNQTPRSTPRIQSALILLMFLAPGIAVAQAPDPKCVDSDYCVSRDKETRKYCTTWQGVRRVPYRIDSAGNSQTPGITEFTAIVKSFDTWKRLSDSCSDWVIERGPDYPQGLVGKTTTTERLVVFREVDCDSTVPASDPCRTDEEAALNVYPSQCVNTYRCWGHDPGALAVTTTSYIVSEPQIGFLVDADIELNAAPLPGGGTHLFTTVDSPPCNAGQVSLDCVATDVQNTMVHEIGHLFGFDHVGRVAATMYWTTTTAEGETQKRLIDQGTALGFCSTYPAAEPTVSCEQLEQKTRRLSAKNAGTSGLQGIGCQASDSLVAPLVVFLLMQLMRRRSTVR